MSKTVFVVVETFYDDTADDNFDLPVSVHSKRSSAEEAAKLYVGAKVREVNFYEE